MRRYAAVAIVVLVVFASVAVALPEREAAPAPGEGPAARAGTTPVPVDGSSARLVVDRPERFGSTAVEADLAASLAERGESLRQTHERESLLREFQRLNTTFQRDQFVDRVLERLDGDAQALLRKQQGAIAAYSTGAITKETLLRRLGRIHASSEQLMTTLARIEEVSENIDRITVGDRIKAIRGELAGLQGPVREHVSAALAAEESLPRVRVVASESALVLALIDDGTYLRESTFLQNRGSTGNLTVESVLQADAKFDAFYPWVSTNFRGRRLRNFGDQIYRTQYTNPQGQTTAYLDAHTGAVYRETHSLQISMMPTHRVETVTRNGIQVVVNRTYPGGPVAVSVYAADDGTRLSATVTVGNRTVGSGTRVWFVEPVGSYAISVTTASGSVTFAGPD